MQRSVSTESAQSPAAGQRYHRARLDPRPAHFSKDGDLPRRPRSDTPPDRRPPHPSYAAGFDNDRSFIPLKFILLAALTVMTMILEAPRTGWNP